MCSQNVDLRRFAPIRRWWEPKFLYNWRLRRFHRIVDPIVEEYKELIKFSIQETLNKHNEENRREFISVSISRKPQDTSIIVILGVSLGEFKDEFCDLLEKLHSGEHLDVVSICRPWHNDCFVAFKPDKHGIDDVLKVWSGNPIHATVIYI